MIESRQNKSFKMWMKLKTKKYRDALGLFLVFGEDLIKKAQDLQCVVETVTTNPYKNGILITKELMNLLQTDTDFDIFAVCKRVEKPVISDRILILDDIQDPANLGALIRSAAAFGFLEIYISFKSADLYHEKTIRTSKGAIFDCHTKRLNLVNKITELQKNNYLVICTDAHGNNNQLPISLPKVALVLGNEGQGVSKEIKALCDYMYTIKTNNVESLNVAAAGAILMHLWRGI